MDDDNVIASTHGAPDILGGLMPLHLVLGPDGRVISHGPTLGRVFDGQTLEGAGFLDLFEVKSPVGLSGPERFADLAGQKLRLVAKTASLGLRLRGVMVPLPPMMRGIMRGAVGRLNPGKGMAAGKRPRAEAAGWIVNLSFGIDLPRAVAGLHLTDADFAPTDLAMELLYLAEANVAVTGELRGLALRLDGARHQAKEEAETDTLTGLRNRRACDSMLARLCREGAPFALMQMDLDYFKAVNDSLGHAAGDHVLMHVAGVMKAASRSGDCLARVGGDEFVMLLPGMTDAVAVRHIAERMILQLQDPIPWQDTECRISATVGFVMVAAGEIPDPARVLASADEALYAGKNAGRSRVMQAALSQEE